MATISYIPAPHERAYYEALFRAADVQRTGNIGGGPAVQFFSRSKLPIDVLKNIWTVADQPSTSSLDLKKFAVAIRLIQLTQNGKKGEGSNLAVAEGVVLRPAMFEGVSGVTVQLPPQPGQQQQQQAPPQQQPPQQQPPQQQQQQQQPPQQQQQPPPQQQQPPPQQQRQQQNQPPPSPAGQRPSIQQQQMQQQAPPPTPSRQGMPPPTPGGSRALVGQDPYAMTPQERARYESLFPQYAKPDGFIYGKEAVELFMKSGVDQRALRDIWNMVDRPIDNRLDALEFAMAMHLIVCISKKGLPHPTAGLPSSLKALKAAVPATPSGQQRPSVQAPTPGQQAAPGAMPAPAAASASSMPSPTPHRQSFQPQAPPQGPQYGAPQPGAPPAAMPQSTSFEQPQPAGSLSPTRQVPPVVATSGMSISDAFEGLSTTSGDVHQQPSSLPAYVPEQRRESRDYAATPAVPEEYTTELPPQQPPTPAPAPVPVPVPQLDAARSMGSSYDMADSNGELVKLKTVLQKLQAENISLKAQLGTMTEEEKDVQKEIGATVAEISQLSTELAGLRGEVLAAKSRLLEASAQLKAAREKKGTLTEQVAEAKSTKDAINEAYSAVENTAASAHHEEHHAVEQQKNQAVRQSDLFESNLFGGGGGAPPASIPAPQQQQHMYPPPIQHSMSHDTSDSRQLSAAPGSVASGSFPNQSAPPMQLPPPQAVNKSIPIVQTVSSEDEQEVDMSAPAASSNAEELFTNEFEPPAPAPGIGEPQNPPQPDMGMPPPQQFGQPPPPQQYQTQQYEPQPPPPEVAQSQPSRPNALAGHNRQSSGFAADFVMGGAAIPLSEGPESAVSPAARTYSDSSAYGYDDDDEYQNVEELKKKAESARETAGDAEAAHRKLVNEANELRQDADKSEAMSRSLRAAAEEKKKGTFGGGKKKKLVKEAEKAAADAAEIKKRFLAVQGQANDAQAVAMETKREADRLREEAEKAEYEMAAKASVKEQEKEQAAQAQAPAPPPAPTPSAPAANGYGQQYPPQQGYGYGQPPAPQGQQYPPPQQSNGYGPPPGQYPPPHEAYGYGQPPPMYGGAPPAAEMGYGGGFAAGVMGGGGEKGFDLPSPNQMTQPAGDYANPFDN